MKEIRLNLKYQSQEYIDKFLIQKLIKKIHTSFTLFYSKCYFYAKLSVSI